MRGQEPIIEMRKRHLAPAMVYLNDWTCETNWTEYGDHATVSVAGDEIARLDLRFLVGLRVSISSTSEQRAKALFEAAKAVEPKVVAACHVKPEKAGWAQDGWCEVHTRG